MGMIVPGGITGCPCCGGGAGSGLGICIIGEFIDMACCPCAGVIKPAPGGGPDCCCCENCASGMDIDGAINGGAIWVAAAPSDDPGY
jgi:hypothetical protein